MEEEEGALLAAAEAAADAQLRRFRATLSKVSSSSPGRGEEEVEEDAPLPRPSLPRGAPPPAAPLPAAPPPLAASPSGGRLFSRNSTNSSPRSDSSSHRLLAAPPEEEEEAPAAPAAARRFFSDSSISLEMSCGAQRGRRRWCGRGVSEHP